MIDLVALDFVQINAFMWFLIFYTMAYEANRLCVLKNKSTSIFSLIKKHKIILTFLDRNL